LDAGMTAASTINDAPITVYDSNLEGLWRPENYSGRFYGPTRLRDALAKSRNLVSIRLMQKLGIPSTVEYFKRFGFPLNSRSGNLSLSLGSSEFTPIQVARAYAAFANTGYLIEPYFVKEVRGYNGELIYQANPKLACNEMVLCVENDPNAAPRIIERRNAYIMTSIMQDVINYGSGRKAKALNRQDIAGKTGTTNDQKDAWFSGFNPEVVTTVWTGFDQPSTLGRIEVGGRASLPTWMAYMKEALKPYPNQPFLQPSGIVSLSVDKRTGQPLALSEKGGIYEIFREESAPEIPTISREKIDRVIENLFN
jgi:penicillin-binding protein 1A